MSDSATPAGNYADRYLAISCTGIGEDIVDCAVGPRLAAWVETGMSLSDAADRMVAELEADGRELGFIAVDADGNTSARYTTQCMTYRIWSDGMVDGWPG